MPSCICGNFIYQSAHPVKTQFSLELCRDCLKAGNSQSYWNSKEYVCERDCGDEHLYNKDQNDN